MEYWKTKLSVHSRKNLRRLLSRELWRSAFDDILVIPGLRRGMSLSSMHQIMNVHCDEVRKLVACNGELTSKTGDSLLPIPYQGHLVFPR